MPIKEAVSSAYRSYKDRWLADDDDLRKEFTMTVDFIVNTNLSYTAQLKLNNHLFNVLLSDPLVQKDTKEYIKAIISDNNRLLGIEDKKEVVNG